MLLSQSDTVVQILKDTVPKAAVLTKDITEVKDWATPLIIAGAIIFAGIIIQRGIIVYIQRISKKAGWKGGPVLVSSIRGMIVLVSILFGTYFGVSQAPVGQHIILIAQNIHKVLIIFIITFIIARVLKGLLRVYSAREETSKGSLSLFESSINIIVYCFGILAILQSFNISITPILTALGVGGLAVALALQDTLANLFAGIQISLTRTVKMGDYIHLSTGEEGRVVDVTWRSTSLLTQANTLTVIPNSKLSTTNLTNYSHPRESFSVSVLVGVSYNSDLDKVERITLEVAGQVMKEGGMEDKPSFVYKEFGASSINFNLTMGINQFSQQDNFRHQFIKRLYKRFKAEGIDIPFPTTSVYLKKENGDIAPPAPKP